VVNGLAFWAYGRALGRGDLSLVLPLINLSPLVLLLSGWILLGERPGGLALAGVLMVVSGALALGRTTGSPGNLLGSPGARLMLLVAVLWGVGASIDKLGVRAGGSLTWVAGLNLVVSLPLLLPAERPSQPWQRSGWLGWVLLMAVLGLVGMALQMEALQRTAVVHVIAIKRLSTLFSAVVGVVGLGEPSGTVRLPAAVLMLGGALVILRFASG
jgi:drug/metabolite transporter (DMT)-like permease